MMDIIVIVKDVIAWVMANGLGIGAVLVAAMALAEAIVRLTPTTSDDGAVERIGKIVSKILDWLKFPNIVK